MHPIHAVIIKNNKLLEHSIMTGKSLENTDTYEIIKPLHSLSFYPFGLIVLEERGLSKNKNCAPDLEIILRLDIEDEQDNKPLFHRKNDSRDLFILSEIISGILECTKACDFELRYLKRIEESSAIEISLALSKMLSHKKILGGMIYLFAAIDSLFFARGLIIGNTNIEFRGDKDLDSLLKEIVEKRGDYSCRTGAKSKIDL